LWLPLKQTVTLSMSNKLFKYRFRWNTANAASQSV
jgi:hypothetical protein